MCRGGKEKDRSYFGSQQEQEARVAVPLSTWWSTKHMPRDPVAAADNARQKQASRLLLLHSMSGMTALVEMSGSGRMACSGNAVWSRHRAVAGRLNVLGHPPSSGNKQQRLSSVHCTT